ncbi:hypothetical protein BD413DRAFT_496516 [Trametes elegans]|nr:hypothetical protein BD413DRAFT_496516 [Trametes elegans]
MAHAVRLLARSAAQSPLRSPPHLPALLPGTSTPSHRATTGELAHYASRGTEHDARRATRRGRAGRTP